tara:strand:+ start:2366 stop:2620 length:255 start_codon:yes stop_codon:yes gene_type:complete
MSTEETKKPLFSIIAARRNEEGHLEFDFDLSDEFVERFKEEHDLKRWSQKRFDEWVSDNIDTILEATGINDQLRSENENNTNEE